ARIALGVIHSCALDPELSTAARSIRSCPQLRVRSTVGATIRASSRESDDARSVEAETQAEPSAELARLMARRPPTSTPARRPDIALRGTTDSDIANSIRRGNWTAIRPGRYLPSNAYGAMDSGAKHRSLIAAMVPDIAPESTISHTSAAAFFGIPM